MKKLLFIILISLVTGSAYAADVGVSISVGQPGFYGQIDIGSAPEAGTINPSPVVIQPGSNRVVGEPIYLHVPPAMQKTGRSSAPNMMLATDPSISFATSGIIMSMCRIIGNIRRNIIGENPAIDVRERGDRGVKERGDSHDN